MYGERNYHRRSPRNDENTARCFRMISDVIDRAIFLGYEEFEPSERKATLLPRIIPTIIFIYACRYFFRSLWWWWGSREAIGKGIYREAYNIQVSQTNPKKNREFGFPNGSGAENFWYPHLIGSSGLFFGKSSWSRGQSSEMSDNYVPNLSLFLYLIFVFPAKKLALSWTIYATASPQLHDCVRWSPILGIREWRAWCLPGRWTDGGRGSEYCRKMDAVTRCSGVYPTPPYH